MEVKEILASFDTQAMDISKIRPYAKNAKKHDTKQIENVANSIRRFGWQQPIVVDEHGEIIIGHCRWMAARKLGLKQVPVKVAQGLSEDEIKELRIVDNKSNESDWDFKLLAEDIKGLGFDGFDFDWDGLDDDEDTEVVEDGFTEDDIPDEATAQRGDIYQLGAHRIMCGDSTDIADVYALMGGYNCDLFLTDPPYNVDYTGGTKDALKIMNDSMEDGKFRAFLTDAFKNANQVMNPGAAYYIWHADSEGLNFRCAAMNAGWKLRQTLIWVKNALVLGRQDYQWKHEPCLYGWKDGTHYFTPERTETTVIDDKIDIHKLKKDEMLELLTQIFSDKTPTTVLYEDKPLANDIHPTMKPITLMARLIRNSTKPEQAVLDLFGGSGSTMMACEQLNRQCFTMELDPRYVDAMIKRWEDFTGEKAIKLA